VVIPSIPPFRRVCSKGAALGETLDSDGRLLHPEIRGARTSWDEALDAVAGGFARTIAAHGPDSVAFYVSGQLLTEDYYVANKLMKGFIGSANIDTNSRLCMASAVAGYKRAFGADAVPNDYTDLEQAELIVLVGSNLAWCHPVLFQRVSAAKAATRKLKIVLIDPRRTQTADIADLHLQLRVGSDVVLFNGLLNYLRREDALDLEFLDAHTEGFGAALRCAKESAASIPAVAAACGLADDDVLELYRWFARTPKTVTAFSQGVNQSTSGTDKVNAIVNVHLATGRIGKPGMGPFSLTGQPNAMGGREVGGLANQLAAHMDFSDGNVDRVARFWGARRVAARPGLKAVDLFDAVERGAVKAVWIMSTNPVVSMPDAERVRRALQGCELVVVSDCVRDTDTTRCAHVLLPAATWGEKAGTVTNSERRISRQRSFMPPPGEAQPDWWIVAQVAKRMGFGAAFDYEGPAAVFREHARLSAFENGGERAFDIGAVASLSDAEYETLQPFQWPRPANVAAPPRLFADGRFFTASRKAQLVPTPPRAPALKADADYPLVLNTGRVRDQWHDDANGQVGAALRPSCRAVRAAPSARCGAVRPRARRLAEVATAAARIVVRLEITDAVTPARRSCRCIGAASSRATRACALIPAAVDAISVSRAQGDAGRVRRYEPKWYGFALSRAPIELPATSYRAVSAAPATGATSSPATSCPPRGQNGPTPCSARERRASSSRTSPAAATAARTSRAKGFRRVCSSPPQSRCRRAPGWRRCSPRKSSRTPTASRSSRGVRRRARSRPGPSSARASRSGARRCCARFAATSSCRSSRSARRSAPARTAARASRSSKVCWPSRPRAARA
jgi:assimilatory nitrate reductase catalytic subunit